jgi:urea carboxylase
MEQQLDTAIEALQGRLPKPGNDTDETAVLHSSGSTVYRAAGDRYLLIEVGNNELNIDLRVRIHALEKLFRQARLRGILDITPGIRSLQIHYDSRVLHREELIACMDACEQPA